MALKKHGKSHGFATIPQTHMADAFKNQGERKAFNHLMHLTFGYQLLKIWKHLPKTDVMKMIIIKSFQWLKQNELVNINGYVPINRDARSHTYIEGTIKDEWKRNAEGKF